MCLQYPLNPIQIRKKRCKWHSHRAYLHGSYFPLTSAEWLLCCSAVILVYKSFNTSQHYVRGQWLPHMVYSPSSFICTCFFLLYLNISSLNSLSFHMTQASQLGVYKAFVDNYKVALETAEKCSQANSQFQKISEVSSSSRDEIWLREQMEGLEQNMPE